MGLVDVAKCHCIGKQQADYLLDVAVSKLYTSSLQQFGLLITGCADPVFPDLKKLVASEYTTMTITVELSQLAWDAW